MWIDRQDLLFAVRAARRAPLLSIIAVAALSLGIGLNAGVFTLLNALFLSAPTQKDPSRFVQVYPKYEGWFTGAGQYSSFTTEDYDAVRTQSKTLEEIAAWQNRGAILEQAHRAIPALLVTCNYFQVLGIDRPLLGRFLTPQECERGTTAQVALLSEPLWRSRFDANPHIVGETIHLNGLPYTVVGVVRASDTNPRAGGVFAPYTTEPLYDHAGTSQMANPDAPWLEIAGRLRPGYSRADAQAELTTILRQQDRAYIERKVTSFNRKTTVELTNGSFIETPALRDTLAALMALILGPLSLVLLLACSNVTMLFLSRAVVRRGEIAVRLALGVGRARLMRMLVLESLLTALIGGGVSVAMAYRVPQMIMNVANPTLAGLVPAMRPDWRVFGYLAVLVAVAAIASSLAPVHAAWKLDLVTALKGRESTATMRSRLIGGLIIAQIAMSFVLLAAAVLFARMPGMVTAIDPGFETRQTLSVPLAIDNSPQNRTKALSFYGSLEAQIRSIPGVQGLAYETLEPFRQTPPSEIRLPQQQKGQGEPAVIDNVSTDFFSTFGIRMLAGRPFVSSDSSASRINPVAVVTQAFVKQAWPGEDPVGKIIITPDDKRLTVVGVAADTRSARFGVLDGPRVYTLRDPSALEGRLYVRFTGSVSTMEKAVFDAVKSIDGTQVMTPQTIWEQMESDAESVRSLARIIVVMAVIAVLLAVTGVYGVMSFAISQRTREFGIRMVLGANRAAIFESILLRGGRQIAVGLVCGLALAEPVVWAFAHLIKNSPFPFRSFDGSAFGIAAAILVCVSLAGMYLPARRATQVDPMKALRTE
ncbi:ADOP family duplicated permease [Occallatibacter riparius]|uniref:ADOP family duplicated permease n=1 Tax=Occallatibacter riparius TaxID=1002689 RepID=A0A9J7BTR1_9BACT|nr:ADOP family duplicated permease [Occallatibacter riparius]UWZ84302.1 ADOP family duplicated permease [Occallatibacter riparius]